MFYRILLVVLLSVHVHAEVSIQGMAPASGLSFTFMETANTNVIRGKEIAPGSVFLNTQYGYINHPLVANSNNGTRDLVSGLQTLDIRAGFLILKDLNFSFNLSLNSLHMPDAGSKNALGDSVAQFKYRLTSINSKIQVALIPEFYIPLGSESEYLSTGEFGAAFKVAATRQFGRLKLAAMGGYRYLPGATLAGLDYRKQLIAGVGSEIILTEKLSINLEGLGFFSTPYKKSNSVGEIYAGALWAFSPLTVISAGVSRSGLGNSDNQSLRGIAGFKTYFDDAPKPVAHVPSTKPACFVEPYTYTFHSRPLSDDEMETIGKRLPYKSGTEITTLKYGEMTGVTREGVPYVKDSQIPFAIDLSDLPENASINKINHAWLKMKVNKLSQDLYLGTELICSLDFKLCSGKNFEKKKWHKFFNNEFFNKDKKPVNDRFSKLYLDNPVGTIDGEKLYSKMLTFPLEDLVKGSDAKVKQFFKDAENGKKTLYFVVTDDTFLSNEVSLEVSMGVERCYTQR